jgi:hypothetical protein
MEEPEGNGKMVTSDHKKVVRKRYSAKKGMLEYQGDPYADDPPV